MELKLGSLSLVWISQFLFGNVLLLIPQDTSDTDQQMAMARSPMSLASKTVAVLITASLIVLVCFPLPSALAKSPQPISDSEIREKKAACYADIESGLWGWQCKSSTIAKENCALKCLSHVCYELIYVGDPLEEGEKDYIRGQEFKYCMHKQSLGESLEGIKGAFDY